MFFFLPWGHDQPTYERPWITAALIAACVLVHLALWSGQQQAEADLETAAARVDSIVSDDPSARISFTIEGMPGELDALVTPMVDTDPGRAPSRGDGVLEQAMLDIVDALNRTAAIRFGYQPGSPRPLRVVTHMFVHADVFHLLGNMLFLWLAGIVLESFWPRWSFALLYAGSGLAGLVAHHAFNAHSMVPVIGASGAIAGLLGAVLVGHPKTRIKVLCVFVVGMPRMTNVQVPVWVALPLWAGVELFSALVGFEDGVAYWAHVGGFAFGAVAALLARRFHLVAIETEVPAYEGLPSAPVGRSIAPAALGGSRPPPARARASAAPIAPIELDLVPRADAEIERRGGGEGEIER